MPRLILPFALILLCAAANAVTGDEVNAGAKRMYEERLSEARQRDELDSDPMFFKRVQTIAGKLIAQARLEQGQAAELTWEIHTTTNPEENASCMAGGKILIGQAYVTKLDLNETELAMLISHEIEHALLEHNLKEMREALRLEPERQNRPYSELEDAVDNDDRLMAKLNAFDAEQEMEADHEGLLLAWRAGWPPSGLINYYRKLVRADPMANFARSEHPSPALRLQAMRELVKQIEHND